MKKILILLSIILLNANFITAQNKSTEKADLFFDTYQYVNAITEYKKLAEGKKANGYIYSQLADCYYYVFNNAEASKWYAKAIATSKVDAEIYYKYAQTLKIQNNYSEANKQMEIFCQMKPSDPRAIQHIKNPNYIKGLENKLKLFEVENPIFYTEGISDFGAVLTDFNELYFTSNSSGSSKLDLRTAEPYLDIYKAIRNDDGTFSMPVAVSELNTIYHDGPLAISKDGNTMFFSRDGLSMGQYEKNKSAKVKVAQQGLYKATKVDGKWTNIEALPFNSENYTVTNPSLSKDGKTLFFASNMPGGFGDTDIWKVQILNNNYSKPENLGSKINSSEKESFPFISDSNVLYFSASGRQGFGGLDIYKIDLSLMDEALNIGRPVNSEKDDFSFSFNSKFNVGYFTSNRSNSDLIYNAIPICNSDLSIVVSDIKTGTTIENALVSLFDKNGNSITSKETDKNGNVTFAVQCYTEFNVTITSQNYETASYPVAAISTSAETVFVKLKPQQVIITDKEVLLNSVYFEFNKSNITAEGSIELDKLVKVMNENPTFVIYIKSHTDSKGKVDYNLKLSEQRAQATVQYIISKGIASDRISGKGYGASELKVACGTQCSEEEHALNRRSEFLIVKK
jgi:outer membrane protein OmpA-like peptidoglycan-associated protein/tetratricopeptide (TPR) repeat protein